MIDFIMIDQTNTLRLIRCSIEHSIVLNLINYLIVSRSITLILLYQEQSDARSNIQLYQIELTI